jgi:hypothetical protein
MRPHRLALASALLASLACQKQAADPTEAPADDPGAAVCRHIMSIMTRENPGQFDAEQIDQINAACVAAANVEIAEIGQEKFRVRADCLLAATSGDGLQECYRRVKHEEHEAICNHVFQIALREEQPDLVGVEQFPPDLLAECAADLAKQRETMPAQEFARRRDCVFSAESIAEVDACGSQ